MSKINWAAIIFPQIVNFFLKMGEFAHIEKNGKILGIFPMIFPSVKVLSTACSMH